MFPFWEMSYLKKKPTGTQPTLVLNCLPSFLADLVVVSSASGLQDNSLDLSHVLSWARK